MPPQGENGKILSPALNSLAKQGVLSARHHKNLLGWKAELSWYRGYDKCERHMKEEEMQM